MPAVAGKEEPIRLESLVEPGALRHVVDAQAALAGCGIRVVAASGLELARGGAAGGDALTSRPLQVEGVTVGRIEVLGTDAARARAAAEAVGATLDVLFAAGWARHDAVTARQALVAAQDEITEKTARLQGAVERLNELDRAKSNFLATISHELRTPLTSVIGYTEMILEGMAGAVTKEQREYLETILAKADHLLQIITGILEVARAESGVVRLDRYPIAITDLIHNVAATLSSEASRRAIAVRLPGDRAVPRVLGDTRKLRQVLTQLLTNALKFTPQGGGVAVSAEIGPLSPHAAAAVGLGVVVSVRDTGIGIPPSALAHIFEPFYQVDQSSTRAYGGTGLGLSLAKSYVEAHGGCIWVDSQPGEGSTFMVSLPAVPEEIAAYVAGGPPPP
jgi:signal transduction histidine kinase